MSYDVSIENPRTMADYAYLGIAKHAKKIFKYEGKILEENDPENLHQIRVGMRRLRSVLASFSSVLKLPGVITDKKIGKIARILGLERDADIIQINLETKYKPQLSQEEWAKFEEINEKHLEKNGKQFPSSREILKGDDYQEFKEALQHWLKNPQFRGLARVKIEKLLPSILLPQISNFCLESAWIVGATIDENGEVAVVDNLTEEEIETIIDKKGEDLHTLRKQAKKVRYQLELFQDFYPAEYQDYINFAKEIQTVLGNIQDNICLLNYLDNLTEKWQRKLPGLQQLIRESQKQEWQKWQQLQKRFFETNCLFSLRQIISQPSHPKTNGDEIE